MNIVVTGAAGFVGSWICEKAIAYGFNVIGIDNLTSKVNYTPSEVEFYNADVNDDISSILNRADAIVHAAAHAELRHNWDNKNERDKLFKNNEMATRSVLEQMPDVPIVFLSTAAVYGSLSNNSSNGNALIEQDASPAAIESPYAASKLACESYVAAWAHKKNVPWHALRLVNQVGARYHRGVISDFCKMVNEKQHIHAADNGKQTKSWVSVEDTADAAISCIVNEIPSGIYNITSDEKWSWLDIITAMRNTNDRYFSLSYENKLYGAIGDPINLHVSGDKLSKYYKCERPVRQAVYDALSFIGWAK